MLVAPKSVEDVDLTHLLLTVACADVRLLGLLYNPHLAAGRRPQRRHLDRLTHTVDGGELTLSAIEGLDLVESFTQGLIHIVLC
jgi:hypothetical protein